MLTNLDNKIPMTLFVINRVIGLCKIYESKESKSSHPIILDDTRENKHFMFPSDFAPSNHSPYSLESKMGKFKQLLNV